MLALTDETLQAEICRRERFLKGGSGSLRSPILGGRGHRPPTTVGWQKTIRIALSCSIKMSPVVSLDWSQTTRVTDGRTDGHNYDSQDRASIAASSGKKTVVFITTCNASN